MQRGEVEQWTICPGINSTEKEFDMQSLAPGCGSEGFKVELIVSMNIDQGWRNLQTEVAPTWR